MTTIREIAEKTGYSLSSVSVVLSGKGDSRNISAKTQAKIINAARDMGYTPNVSARRLRSNHIKKMIVVYWATDYRAPLVFRFLQGIYRYMNAKKTAYEIIIHPFSPGKLMEIATPLELSTYSACIICTATEKDIAFLENIKVVTPIILYNRISEKYSSVIVDNQEIGAYAAKVLWERGKKNALIVCVEKSLHFIKERIDEFISSFQSLGGHVQRIDAVDNTISSAYKSVMKCDFSEFDHLGIFCTTDILSMGVLKRINELKINKESVYFVHIAMLDKEISSLILPNSTVIEIPIEKMGYKCLELIDMIIKGDIKKIKTVKIGI